MQFKIDRYDILLHAEAVAILERFTQNKSALPEAGGIILGKIIEGQVNITKLSVPTSLDKRSRFNFERHKHSAQIILEYEFYNSNGQTVYLGEWHTHPEPFPSPSGTDLKMIQSQFRNNLLKTDFLILMIKGTKGIYLRVVDLKGYHEVQVTL
ncbi:Mov34/MPN/PAD-1 family protein [Olivibacter sp. XZL3]|uniref:Mov34/MPN/PAD-1 family protein n=1 Tax=Olivibacter sp. XZL3 TaxID=1735116 RepID=UPI0010655E0B|nr:Mov34/MPN/PAD-1 family protein [Olivibacter sp. XZL3]